MINNLSLVPYLSLTSGNEAAENSISAATDFSSLASSFSALSLSSSSEVVVHNQKNEESNASVIGESSLSSAVRVNAADLPEIVFSPWCPITLEPARLSSKMFSYLDHITVRHICARVSKAWLNPIKEVEIQEEQLYQELRGKKVIFGPEDWGAGVDHPNARKFLDPMVYKLIASPCPFFPGKTREKTHVLMYYPGTYKGKDTTFMNLGDEYAATDQGKETNGGFVFINPRMITDHGNTPTGPGRWLLIPLQIAAKTLGMSEGKQLEYLRARPGYRLIQLGEVTALVFTRRLSTGEFLLSDHYTRTEQRCHDIPTIVGCSGVLGLTANYTQNDEEAIGVLGVVDCGSSQVARS